MGLAERSRARPRRKTIDSVGSLASGLRSDRAVRVTISSAFTGTAALDVTLNQISEFPEQLGAARSAVTPTIVFNDDFAQRFAERLAAEDPEPQYKRRRAWSRRELVAKSYETIMRKRRDGYSFEGIAKQFAALGLPISIATLKHYLQQHAAKRKAQLQADTQSRAAAESVANAGAQGPRHRAPTRGQSRASTAPKNPKQRANPGGGEELDLVHAKSASNAAAYAVDNGRADATDGSGACSADQVPTEVSDAGTGGDRAAAESSTVVPAESEGSSEDGAVTGDAEAAAQEVKPIAAADLSRAHAKDASGASHHAGAASEAAASQGRHGREPTRTPVAGVAANSLTNPTRFSNIGFMPRR
jgi:hypothetical protein